MSGALPKVRPGPLEYLGRWPVRAWLVAVVIFLYAPLVTLMAFSFNTSKRNIVWRGFTLDWYKVAFQDWDGKQVVTISRSMIDSRFAMLSKGSKSQANLAFRFLRALLNYAMEKFSAQEDGESVPLIPSNPVNRLTVLKMWHKLEPRTGNITPEQLRPVEEALSRWQGLATR